MHKSVSHEIKDPSQYMRLDLFLTKTYADKGYNRSYWSKMIANDFVHVNGDSAKSGLKLRDGDKVQIDWPTIDRTFENKVQTLDVTDDIVVLVKPAGMLTHSKGRFNPEYTVADFMRQYVRYTDNEGTENNRAGIVHRLDRHTSGVLVAARTKESLQSLQKLFQDRKVQKYYLAIAEGTFNQERTSIDGAIGRDPSDHKRRTITEDGKSAHTDVTVINKSADKTLVLLRPSTGRTHQLRVHLAHIGHPIVGDTLYGARESLNNHRFLLHAYILQIPLKGRVRTYIAPIPEDMSSYISNESKAAITNAIE